MSDERDPDGQEPPDATYRLPPSEPTGPRRPRRGAPSGPPPPADSFRPGRPVRPAEASGAGGSRSTGPEQPPTRYGTSPAPGAPPTSVHPQGLSGPSYAPGREPTPSGDSGARHDVGPGYDGPGGYGSAGGYDGVARYDNTSRYDGPAGYDSGGQYGDVGAPVPRGTPQPGPEPAPVPRRRRRRWPKILAIVLAFLMVLLVIGDRVAVRIANGVMKERVAAEIAAQAEPGTPPATVKDVSMGGFPFLTQVFFGKYKDMRFTIENIITPGPRIQQVKARLQGVHVPFGDAIRDNVGEVPVDVVEGTAVVTYVDLNAFLERDPTVGEFFKDLIPGFRKLRVDPEGGGEKVKATLTIDVPIIGDQDFAGVARFNVRDNVLFLDVDQIGIGGTFTGSVPLPDAFQFDFPVPDLPLGMKLAAAGTNATGLSLTVRGIDTVLPAPSG